MMEFNENLDGYDDEYDDFDDDDYKHDDIDDGIL